MGKKKERLKSDGWDEAEEDWDEAEESLAGEGPPAKLAKARGKTYGEAPTTMVRPPPAAPVVATLEGLAAVVPTSYAGAVRLVLDRQAADGHPRNEKQAKRSASMAWPELYEEAGSPKV